MTISVKYKDVDICSIESGNKLLTTKGKYLEDNLTLYSNHRLPTAYQEVEYLQSSGTQYIDTGYNCGNAGYKAICSLEFTSLVSGTSNRVIGSYNGNNMYGRAFFGASSAFQFDYGKIIDNNVGTVIANTNYDVTVDFFSGKSYLIVNNETLLTVDGTISTQTSNVWLFGYSGLGVNGKLKLKYCKMYSISNILIRDFIPCYRKSDSVAGLYDIANGVFYTNAGTGSFTVGGDVL